MIPTVIPAQAYENATYVMLSINSQDQALSYILSVQHLSGFHEIMNVCFLLHLQLSHLLPE